MKHITIWHKTGATSSLFVKKAGYLAGFVWYLEEREGEEVRVILSANSFTSVEIKEVKNDEMPF